MITGGFITADIADSTKHFSSRDMEQIASQIRGRLVKAGCIVSFNRFDSFQALHFDPSGSLELLLSIRMAVRTFSPVMPDVRLCLGLGEADKTIRDFNFLKEPLFVMTGREFDKMEHDHTWLKIILTDPADQVRQPGLTALTLFLDYLIRKLTFKQAEVLTGLLDGLTQKEIAEAQQKSLPTINKQVKALSWEQIRTLERLYRQMIQT